MKEGGKGDRRERESEWGETGGKKRERRGEDGRGRREKGERTGGQSDEGQG